MEKSRYALMRSLCTAESRGYRSGRSSYLETAPPVAVSIGMTFSAEMGRFFFSHCHTMPWETPTRFAKAACVGFGFEFAKYSFKVMLAKIAPLVTGVNSNTASLVAGLIATLNDSPVAKSKTQAGSSLAAWQQEDARRLQKLFKAHAGLSQAEFGVRFSIGTQSAVWQYLSGHRPLNEQALVKFAEGLRVKPQDISPTLTRQIVQLANASKGPAADPHWEMSLEGNTSNTVARPVKVLNTAHPDERGAWEKPLKSEERPGFVNVPSNDPDAFAVRIMGDELQPRVRSGEYLVIEPSRTVNPGDEVWVRTTKAYMIREYLFSQDDSVILCAINGGHGRHTVAKKDIFEMFYVAAIVKASRFTAA